MLDKIKCSSLSTFHGTLSYADYLEKSIICKSVLNPPGVGEYTSRMFDQTAIGNLIILRKNTYDQGHSWKDYIPEVDFSSEDWENEYASILDERILWCQKSNYYYNTFWTSKAIFDFLVFEIKKEL